MPYSRKEALDKLIKLFQETQNPISKKAVEECTWGPKCNVYNRLFGSLEAACKEANVPFKNLRGATVMDALYERQITSWRRKIQEKI